MTADLDGMSRQQLLSMLAMERRRCADRRAVLARQLRAIAAELEQVDRRLSDIESSEQWLTG